MRIYTIITINTLANLIAGAIFAAAFWQAEWVTSLSFVGAAVLISVMATGGAFWKIRKGLGLLISQASTKSQPNVKTGLAEFDAISQRIATVIQDIRQASIDDANELADIKAVLAKLDRRKGNHDRDGHSIPCANQLHLILKGYGGEIDTNVRQAIACGREIRRATEEIVRGTEDQSDAVAMTTSFIERLSDQIIAVSDGTEEALKASALAQGTAQNGLTQFMEIENDMKQIRNQSVIRERKLQALSQHTKEIETIVQTIGTLSSRTDLLALNASIESVRAGEHGRGFAIVADEVRALAEQSAQAVVDISRRIEMIQLDTHQSISVASDEHDQMHQVIKRVTETIGSLEELCNAAGDSTKGLTEISGATNHQLQLTREVIVSLERNKDTSQKNRSRAEGAHWTAKTLGQIGGQLEDSLELFRRSGALAQTDSTADSTADAHSSDHSRMPEPIVLPS